MNVNFLVSYPVEECHLIARPSSHTQGEGVESRELEIAKHSEPFAVAAASAIEIRAWLTSNFAKMPTIIAMQPDTVGSVSGVSMM